MFGNVVASGQWLRFGVIFLCITFCICQNCNIDYECDSEDPHLVWIFGVQRSCGEGYCNPVQGTCMPCVVETKCNHTCDSIDNRRYVVNNITYVCTTNKVCNPNTRPTNCTACITPACELYIGLLSCDNSGSTAYYNGAALPCPSGTMCNRYYEKEDNVCRFCIKKRNTGGGTPGNGGTCQDLSKRCLPGNPSNQNYYRCIRNSSGNIETQTKPCSFKNNDPVCWNNNDICR